MMRIQFPLILIFTILFAGAFLHKEVSSVCAAPLSYRLGHIDDRFVITEDEARVALADAEGSWEKATGRNLFNYDPESQFVVNFVFDERQEYAEAAEVFKELLDVTEDRNESINDTYSELIDRYENLEIAFAAKSDEFESRLDSYNDEVASYNDAGGAPSEAHARLEKERLSLDAESNAINARASELNQLAREINNVSEKGNKLINKYNENVNTFNETFGESRRFTQGDYQGDHINIYKFLDMNELVLVLAHEFGHALSLGHVENEHSILFEMMGAQSFDLSLTEEDLTEFDRVCGEGSWSTRLGMVFGL